MQTTANSIKSRILGCVASVALATVATLGALALGRVARQTGREALQGVPVPADDALVAALAALAALGLAWLVLGVLLEALSLVPGLVGRAARAASAALSPWVVRRVAGVVLGIGVGVGVGGGGAHATPPPMAAAAHEVAAVAVGTSTARGISPAAGSSASVVGLALPDAGWAAAPDPGWAATPDPGWVPARPAVRPQPDLSALGARPTAPTAGPAEVVVHRGDSLWTLAARHLGDGATDAEIAAAWPHWYAANRAVVGPDPDVLLPGQVLRAPALAPEAAS